MRRKQETEPDSFLYSLAHYVVRRLFFGDARRFFRLAEREWDRGFADFVWEQALPFATQTRDWVGRRDQFRCHPVLVKGRKAVLLVFPVPVERTQCHMALAVLTRGKAMGQGRPEYGRYFTLERGKRKRDTVLCEWTGDDCHIYHSEESGPGEEAFIQAVEKEIHLSRMGKLVGKQT